MVAALDHHRAAHLEHARRAAAAADDLVDRLGREPRLHAEHERLGGGDVVDRDQEIGPELEARAVAERPGVVAGAGEAVEDAAAALERALVAAGVNHDLLSHRLGAGAAERRIKHHDPDPLQGAPGRLLALERQGRALEQGRPRAAGPHQPLVTRDDVLERMDAGQQRDHDRRLFRDGARRSGAPAALGLEHPGPARSAGRSRSRGSRPLAGWR
jgi:hypothetical protein